MNVYFFHQSKWQYRHRKRLRLHGTALHEKSHRQRNRNPAPALPLPWLPANRGPRPHAQQRPGPLAPPLGPDPARSDASPLPPQKRHMVHLRPRPHEKRHRTLQGGRHHRHGLRLHPVRLSHRQWHRPAHPVVQRTLRPRTRPRLLQLPPLQPTGRQMDQPRPHR